MAAAVFDWLLHGGTITALAWTVYIGRRVLRHLDRDESLKADYPPHRHVNGFISYPKDYTPPETERV